MSNRPPGSRLEVTLLRGGQQQRITVTTGERGGDVQHAVVPPDAAPEGRIGLRVAPLPPELAPGFGLSRSGGSQSFFALIKVPG